MRKIVYCLLVISMFSSSCTEDIKQRISQLIGSEENLSGVIKYKEINGNIFQATERVIGKFHFEYLSLSRRSNVVSIEQEDLHYFKDEVGKKFSPGIFKIRMDDLSGELLQFNLTTEEQYKQRVEYYSFKINDDLKMVYKNDTLKCLFSTLERTYGLAPEITINCYFENPRILDTEAEYTIIFEDKTFNCGIVKLIMPARNI